LTRVLWKRKKKKQRQKGRGEGNEEGKVTVPSRKIKMKGHQSGGGKWASGSEIAAGLLGGEEKAIKGKGRIKETCAPSNDFFPGTATSSGKKKKKYA